MDDPPADDPPAVYCITLQGLLVEKNKDDLWALIIIKMFVIFLLFFICYSIKSLTALPSLPSPGIVSGGWNRITVKEGVLLIG